MPSARTGRSRQLPRRLPPRDKPSRGDRLDRRARRKVAPRVAILRHRRRPTRGRVPTPRRRIDDRHHGARLPARRHRPRLLPRQPAAPIRPRRATSGGKPAARHAGRPSIHRPFRACYGGGTRRPIGASQAGCTAGRREAGRTRTAGGVLITHQASDVCLPTDWVWADSDPRTDDLVPARGQNQHLQFLLSRPLSDGEEAAPWGRDRANGRVRYPNGPGEPARGSSRARRRVHCQPTSAGRQDAGHEPSTTSAFHAMGHSLRPSHRAPGERDRRRFGGLEPDDCVGGSGRQQRVAALATKRIPGRASC